MERVVRPRRVRNTAALHYLSDPQINCVTRPSCQWCLGLSVSATRTTSPTWMTLRGDWCLFWWYEWISRKKDKHSRQKRVVKWVYRAERRCCARESELWSPNVGSDNSVASDGGYGNAVILNPKSNWLGVSGWRSWMLEFTYVSGRSLRIAWISLSNVDSSGKVTNARPSTFFKDVFVSPINRS